MIRFSAGLVVVAIGVLIGGVATSKLSLVYVAIAVSAVALVALAVGVALKRDELFGGEPELAPAGAGAGSGTSAGQSADASDVHGKSGHVREDLEQIRPDVPAASPSAAFAGSGSGFGQASAREGDSAAEWLPRSLQSPWSSEDQVRPTWSPKEQTPEASPPTVPQPGSAPVSPRAWGNSDQSAPPTRAASGTVAPSWFDRLNQPPAGSVPRTGTDPAKSGPEQAGPEQAQPEQARAPKAEPTKVDPTESVEPSANPADTDDDDWPTRYSWLEDDEADEAATNEAATDEAADAGKPAQVDDAEPAEAEVEAEVEDAEPVEVEDAEPVEVEVEVDETVPDEAKAPAPATIAVAALNATSPDADAKDDAMTADDADAADPAAEPAETPAVDAAHEAPAPEDDPSATRPSKAKLVTVIPGVPRYHQPDCILIRFMDEEDVAQKSVSEAKAANCTPCAACQPEG